MIHVIMPGEISGQLEKMTEAALQNKEYTLIKDTNGLPDLRNKKILFVIQLDDLGFNRPLMEVLFALKQKGRASLQDAIGTLLIHSHSADFTKSAAAHLIYLANQLGCSFIGHPMVEAIEDLKNFRTRQKKMDASLEEIALHQSRRLSHRLMTHKKRGYKNPKLAYLHSSSRETSNTLRFWQMAEQQLKDMDIQELYVENGAVFDCFGCSYKICLEYGKERSCLYGGVMTEKIIPAIESADILLWVCPNYNDAVSSNLMAVINRLTTLYRQISFHDKTMFAMIVSGNSGGDSVAKQLIDALNINKGFFLPPYFCSTEIANDPGSILKVPGIDKKARSLAESINGICED